MEQQTNGRQQNAENSTTTNAAPKSAFARLKEKFLPGIKITLLISLIFYLAMFIVGCMGVHQCPVNQNIPLFLIATGGIGLFSKLISVLRDKIIPHFKIQFIESLLYTAETVFLILGSYWVFKEYQPSYQEGDLGYCQKTVYMFAFIYLAILYAFVIAIILGFLCFLGCVIFVQKTETNNRDPEAQVQIQPSNQESP